MSLSRQQRRRRVQVDELWSFVGAKQKNLTPENEARGAVGDIWLWRAIDADTKLVPSWLLGDRNARTARAFMLDFASRLNGRVQLTTNAHGAYLRAVEGAFGHDIDYAQLQELYGETSEAEKR
jgi:IS1 family transposase